MTGYQIKGDRVAHLFEDCVPVSIYHHHPTSSGWSA
jgi:hypothetical protein